MDQPTTTTEPPRTEVLEIINRISTTDPAAAAKLLARALGVEQHYQPSGSPHYRTSHHSTPKLDIAVAAAMGRIRNAVPNRENVHLKSSYADLAAVYEACRHALSEAGVALTSPVWGDATGQLWVTTRIACSGEWTEADFPVMVEEHKGLNHKQVVGVALTYVRRYSVISMLNIATGDDHDGDDGQRNDEHANPAAAKWSIAINAFAEFKIQPGAMLKALGRSVVGDVTDEDHEKLKATYMSMDNGATPGAAMKLLSEST